MQRAHDDGDGVKHRHKRAATDAAVALGDGPKDDFSVQLRRLDQPLFCLVETLIWCARARLLPRAYRLVFCREQRVSGLRLVVRGKGSGGG